PHARCDPAAERAGVIETVADLLGAAGWGRGLAAVRRGCRIRDRLGYALRRLPRVLRRERLLTDDQRAPALRVLLGGDLLSEVRDLPGLRGDLRARRRDIAEAEDRRRLGQQCESDEEEKADDDVEAKRRQVALAAASEKLAGQETGAREQRPERSPESRVGVREPLEGLAHEMAEAVGMGIVALPAGGAVPAGERRVAVEAARRLAARRQIATTVAIVVAGHGRGGVRGRHMIRDSDHVTRDRIVLAPFDLGAHARAAPARP